MRLILRPSVFDKCDLNFFSCKKINKTFKVEPSTRLGQPMPMVQGGDFWHFTFSATTLQVCIYYVVTYLLLSNYVFTLFEVIVQPSIFFFIEKLLILMVYQTNLFIYRLPRQIYLFIYLLILMYFFIYFLDKFIYQLIVLDNCIYLVLSKIEQ